MMLQFWVETGFFILPVIKKIFKLYENLILLWMKSFSIFTISFRFCSHLNETHFEFRSKNIPFFTHE